MTSIQTAQLYFDLSNKSDFDGIAKLFSDTTSYDSQNTGEYKGVDEIIAMQRAFHSKFKTLRWKVNSVEEIEPGTVLFDYDFEAVTKDGKKMLSSGLEYVTIDNGKIHRVEIRNKK